MFIGHFGVALGAKRAAPGVSLGVLFLACQLADLIWPPLVLLGLEIVQVDPGNTAFTPLDFVSYPYSHSLLGLTISSAVLGTAYAMRRGHGISAAAIVAAVGVSHWVLDVITHRPDLPLTFWGTERLGLGLWNSVPATIALELPMFLVGMAVYAQATVARDRIGSLGFWTLVAFLVVVYAVNVLGPPPPSSVAVAVVAQFIWLLVVWAFWVDRHRALSRPNG